MALALYWPRLNTAGATAGMLAGFLAHFSLYGVGFLRHGSFQAVCIASLDPLIPGVAVSILAALLVSLTTAPPPERLVRKFFCRNG
ncbi:MAG: hypothetical protein ABIK89_18185, partial [Planctomycetota bacterium]